MKVCMIVGSNLPVPAVKGGAIETLATSIIDFNEVENRLELTVITVLDEEAKKNSEKYKNTNFIFIERKKADKVLFILFRIIKKMFKKQVSFLNRFDKRVTSYILKRNTMFDIVISERAHTLDTFIELRKIYRKDQLVHHTHNEDTPNKIVDDTFGSVIGVSNYLVEEWKKNSTSSPDTHVLLNGIDTKKFSKEISSNEYEILRSKYTLEKNDFVVLYCGRLVPEKGVKELIIAIKQLKYDNLRLLIAGGNKLESTGKTEYVKEIEHIVSECNGKVVFTGYIPNNELFKIYKISNLLIVPSMWEEGAGLVVLEGMASGIPIIVSRSGGMPEYASNDTIIIDREDIVNNIKESITLLYNNKELLDSMVENGYKHVRKFDDKKYYDNFCEILSIIHKRGLLNDEKRIK